MGLTQYPSQLLILSVYIIILKMKVKPHSLHSELEGLYYGVLSYLPSLLILQFKSTSLQ